MLYQVARISSLAHSRHVGSLSFQGGKNYSGHYSVVTAVATVCPSFFLSANWPTLFYLRKGLSVSSPLALPTEAVWELCACLQGWVKWPTPTAECPVPLWRAHFWQEGTAERCQSFSIQHTYHLGYSFPSWGVQGKNNAQDNMAGHWNLFTHVSFGSRRKEHKLLWTALRNEVHT